MVTITDVARHAGVSVSTVSYAISGARPIRSDTRERVEQAMRELGYQPNAMARSLASRRSNVVALIYPAMDKGLGGTISEFVHAAAERARQNNYHLVLWPFRYTEASQVRDLVRQGMADGVLVMEVALDDERIDVLEEAGIPYTMIGRTRDVSGRNSVDIDFDVTMRVALDHLLDLGHRRIGFLNHSRQSFDSGYAPALRALDAYERLTAERGLIPVSRFCDDSPVVGRQVAAELLSEEPDLTALVTMNEMATFGVVAEIQYQGRVVPDDFSLLGIVTSPNIATMSNPPLTSMHAPGAQLGRLAIDRLLSQIDRSRPETPNVLIPCLLEEGMSVGPAPG